MMPNFKPFVDSKNSGISPELLLSTWEMIQKIYKRT
jgi:hypothetical protein